MRRLAAADACYGGALLTMPLVGVGLVHLVTGRDLGAGVQPAYLLLAVAWALRAAAWLRERAGRPGGAGSGPWSRGTALWLLAAAGALFLSAAGLLAAPAPLLPAEAWPRFAKQTAQAGIMMAFLLYAAHWTRGPQRWRWTVRLLGWSVGLQCAYAVLQGGHAALGLPGVALLERVFTSNPSILAGSTWLYLGGFTDVPRLRGTMCEPLYLGSLLVGTLPLLAWAGWRRTALAAAAVLVLTWARGAWAAAAGSLLVWWLLRRRAGLGVPSRRVVLSGLAAVGVGLLLVTLIAGPGGLRYPIQRLAQTFDATDWSNLTRYYSWQAAWRAWAQSPLVGVGWGQYPYHFYALVDLPGLESQFQWPVVNSWPLLVLCELGLVGFGVLVAAVAALWRRTWRALQSTDAILRRARLAALAAGCCGLGLQSLVFSQYNLPHLWVLPGLWIAALTEVQRRARRAEETA